MSIRNTLLAAVVAAGISLAAGCASATEAETEPAEAAEHVEMDPEQMMEAYAAANAMNEHHTRLAKMEGEWTVAGKSWMAPGEPPMETTGTSTFTKLLGGRYMRQDYSSEFMGMQFQGMGIDGYDNARQKYFSCWYDNMSTATMMSWGDYDAEAKRMTMHADHLNPITGTTEQMRMTVEERSDNEFVMIMYMVVPGGEDLKHMELVYTRKK